LRFDRLQEGMTVAAHSLTSASEDCVNHASKQSLGVHHTASFKSARLRHPGILKSLRVDIPLYAPPRPPCANNSYLAGECEDEPIIWDPIDPGECDHLQSDVVAMSESAEGWFEDGSAAWPEQLTKEADDDTVDEDMTLTMVGDETEWTGDESEATDIEAGFADADRMGSVLDMLEDEGEEYVRMTHGSRTATEAGRSIEEVLNDDAHDTLEALIGSAQSHALVAADTACEAVGFRESKNTTLDSESENSVPFCSVAAPPPMEEM